MDKYQILGKLSSGAFGTVYNAEVIKQPSPSLNSMQTLNLGDTVAIKQVYVTDLVKREMKILEELPPHPNIIKFYEIVQENEFEYNIVMEKGVLDLDQYIESLEYPISEDVVRRVARGVLQGLKHLHAHHTVHRDLKPSNIVLKGGWKDVALCDFGSAVKCIEEGEYVVEGFTRWYKSPEMLFGSRNYKYEVDIWSLGCILLQLASGEQAFPGKSQLQQLALISNFLGDPSPQNWPSITKLHDFGKITFVKKSPKSVQQISKHWGISLELAGFLLKMLRYEGRLTAEQLLKDKFLLFKEEDEGEGEEKQKSFMRGPFEKKMHSKYFRG